jgi:hypothetical protein
MRVLKACIFRLALLVGRLQSPSAMAFGLGMLVGIGLLVVLLFLRSFVAWLSSP